LGIETRQDDGATRAAVGLLDDAVSHSAVLAERALLAALLGGCLAPIGALARAADTGELRLQAVVLSPDGSRKLAASDTGRASEARALGRRVAERLLNDGAAKLIDIARQPR
jgi:hydroxymethylbilane synthase